MIMSYIFTIHFFAISGLINAITAISLGFLVFFKNRKDPINLRFSLMSWAIALWSFFYWLWLSSDTYSNALLWIRILSIGSTLIPILYLHWVFVFLKKKVGKIITFGYILTGVFLLFSFSSLFLKNIEPKLYFPFWPNPGYLYTIYLIFSYFLFISYGFYLLYKTLKVSSDEQKNQIRYIIAGIIFGFIGGATNFFLWYDIPVIPFGNPLVALYPILVTYAIFKHHLMNIKVIATEFLTFITWTFVGVRLLISETPQEIIINSSLLVFLIISGALLIRSVLYEVRTREEMEKLAGDLEIANERLKELDKMKSEFVSIASHQLRTPITAVKGYSSMLLEGSYGQIPEKAKGALEKIFESSNRLVHMITDFLTLSRIERGKMEYNFQKTDLKEIVISVMDEFRAANAKDKKKLDLSLKIDEKEDYNLFIDAEKIRQVIYNIIENAMKYTHQGFVKVSLDKNKDKSKIIVKTKDSGIGLSKESLEKIFQKFSQANSNHTGVIIGVGLGLYVAREIMKVHHGDIRAESKGEGLGSTFYIQLPADFVPPK